MPDRTDRTFPSIPGQKGMATVAQLLEAGWSASALRVQRGTSWQEPLPRVVVPHRGPIDATTRLVAQGLWAGPTSAVLTGASALVRLGVRPRRTDEVTFVVGEGSRARSHGAVRLHRSARKPSVAGTVGVVRVAGPSRALADAAVYEHHSPQDLEHLTISALQRGRATPEALERELYLRPRARVEPLWKGLVAFTGGAWSRPEAVLRDVVEGDGGFPPLLTNCRLLGMDGGGSLVGTPDGYMEAAGVAIQVHSRQYHQGIDDRGGDQWSRTVERDNDMTAAGVRVVGVSPWTLYSRPERFLRRLRAVVAVGLEGPRPKVRVVPSRPDQGGPSAG
ncbi:hypothetical protein ACPYOC_04500 [Ornithinimicrobium sp. W1665]|uniref:hypothetical protein n=1 Tax=Ornithinimicrobium sp. W1665 TaxID=3416666 RepID=UPI003CE9AC1B